MRKLEGMVEKERKSRMAMEAEVQALKGDVSAHAVTDVCADHGRLSARHKVRVQTARSGVSSRVSTRAA